jgi:hypothetical protein
MSDEDHAKLLEACKPVPAIALHCGTPKSRQENADDAWRRLGEKMGFDYKTVIPDGPDSHDFKAVPTKVK